MAQPIAFIMNPLELVTVATDTSFAFMLAAQNRGHTLIHVHPKDLHLEGEEVFLTGRKVEVKDQQGEHFADIETGTWRAKDLAAVFVRTDPPFDEMYLWNTWLLDFAEAAGVRVVNSPRGIRDANEKLYALKFPDVCPPTVVTNRRDDILRIVKEWNGEAIAKPIDGHGGFGVVRLRADDSNALALIDMLTHEQSRPIIIQQFLPEIAQGDKRLFFVDGKLRAALSRLPAGADHRSNVHVGGKVRAAIIDADDERIAEAMGEQLKKDGLYFAGADVIGGKLIEVNVTSPTLVRELHALGGPDLADEIVASLGA